MSTQEEQDLEGLDTLTIKVADLHDPAKTNAIVELALPHILSDRSSIDGFINMSMFFAGSMVLMGLHSAHLKGTEEGKPSLNKEDFNKALTEKLSLAVVKLKDNKEMVRFVEFLATLGELSTQKDIDEVILHFHPERGVIARAA